METFLRASIKLGGLGILCFLGALVLTTWTEPILSDPLEQGLAFLSTGGKPLHPLDEKGVPRVYYFRLQEAFENPVYVCIYAYGYYQLWKGSKDYDYFLKYYAFRPPKGLSSEQYRDCFFACADWLVEHLKPRTYEGKSFYVWEYSFPWQVYDLEPPWVSGMAQGCGMEVLVRAYQESADPRYLQTAQKAMTAFFVPIEAGGVLRKDSSEAWWYEEYASPGCKESRVLNGMVHALIGLYHYEKASGDPEAAFLLRKGCQALKTELPKYDTGRWTYYDQLGQIAKLKYHQINISTLEYLGERIGESLLTETAQRWKSYRSDYFSRYFLWQRPLRFYTFLFAVNMVLVALPITAMYFVFRKIRRSTGPLLGRAKRSTKSLSQKGGLLKPLVFFTPSVTSASHPREDRL